MRAIAIYSCKAEDSSELSFNTGDFINKVQKDEEEGWFSGELNGRRGLFPGNYVRFEEDPPGPPITNIAHILAHLPTAPERPPKINAKETRRMLSEKSNLIVTSGSAKFAQNAQTRSMYEIQPQGYPQVLASSFRPSGELISGFDLSKKKKPPPPPGKNRESLVEQAIKKSPPPSPPSGRSSSVSSGLNKPRLSATQSLAQKFENMNTSSVSAGVANSREQVSTRISQTTRPATSFSAQSLSSSNFLQSHEQYSLKTELPSGRSQPTIVAPANRFTLQHTPFDSSAQRPSCQSQQNIRNQDSQASVRNFNPGFVQNSNITTFQKSKSFNNNPQSYIHNNQEYGSQQSFSQAGGNQLQSNIQKSVSGNSSIFLSDREARADPSLAPSISAVPTFDRNSKVAGERKPPQIPARPSSNVRASTIFDKLNESTYTPILPGGRPVAVDTPKLSSSEPITLRDINYSIQEALPRYTLLFRTYDKLGEGKLQSSVVKNIWTRSQLDFRVLGQIWNFLKVDGDYVNLREFCIGMFLIDESLRKKTLVTSVDSIRKQLSMIV